MNCHDIFGHFVVHVEEKTEITIRAFPIARNRNERINKKSNNKTRMVSYSVDWTILELLMCGKYSLVLMRSNAQVHMFDSFFKYLLNTTHLLHVKQYSES